jgi:hypothetical protein
MVSPTRPSIEPFAISSTRPYYWLLLYQANHPASRVILYHAMKWAHLPQHRSSLSRSVLSRPSIGLCPSGKSSSLTRLSLSRYEMGSPTGTSIELFAISLSRPSIGLCSSGKPSSLTRHSLSRHEMGPPTRPSIEPFAIDAIKPFYCLLHLQVRAQARLNQRKRTILWQLGNFHATWVAPVNKTLERTPPLSCIEMKSADKPGRLT